MSLILVLLAGCFLILVFSQFGARVAARKSLPWWLASLFLILGVLWPSALLPVAKLLGVQLVSNMVLGGLIVFLMIQILLESSEGSASSRKLRQMVCAEASRACLAKRTRTSAVDGGSFLVVCPCYNEEANLAALLRSLESVGVHYCVVNDGSADGSAPLLERSAQGNHATHLVNVGVAGVLITGFSVALAGGYSYVVQCDSDGQHPIHLIEEFVRHARDKNLDLLVGSRFSQGTALAPEEQDDGLGSTTLMRRFGGLCIALVLRLFSTKCSVSDPTSGFRVYSVRAMRYLLKHMPDEYPEPETLALLLAAGFSVSEVRVPMYPRRDGVSSLSGFRKSVGFMVKVLSALLGLRLRTLGRRQAEHVLP